MYFAFIMLLCATANPEHCRQQVAIVKAPSIEMCMEWGAQMANAYDPKKHAIKIERFRCEPAK